MSLSDIIFDSIFDMLKPLIEYGDFMDAENEIIDVITVHLYCAAKLDICPLNEEDKYKQLDKINNFNWKLHARKFFVEYCEDHEECIKNQYCKC